MLAITRIFTLTIVVILACGTVRAQDLYDLYTNSVSRQPFVAFVARAGTPGHAFVIIGEELDNGLNFELGVFGFYPVEGKTQALKALFSTDGVIAHKWADMDRDVFFRQEITSNQKDKALDVLETWKKRSYSLFGNNCNKLAAEVAEAVDLSLPEKSPETTLPVNFIKALSAANPQ